MDFSEDRQQREAKQKKTTVLPCSLSCRVGGSAHSASGVLCGALQEEEAGQRDETRRARDQQQHPREMEKQGLQISPGAICQHFFACLPACLPSTDAISAMCAIN